MLHDPACDDDRTIEGMKPGFVIGIGQALSLPHLIQVSRAGKETRLDEVGGESGRQPATDLQFPISKFPRPP